MQIGFYFLWHQAGRIQTSTYFFALHTEDSRDPLWSKWRSTQQAVWLSVTTNRLLNIIQATGKTPEKNTHINVKVGTGVFFAPKIIQVNEHLCVVEWCDSLLQRQWFSISLNPLLLHVLHHGRSSQHAVDYLLLLIREVLPQGAARHAHCPPNLEPKTHTKTDTHRV